MTDKKLTDEEIKKALECCDGSFRKCFECPYDNSSKKCWSLEKSALDLINRLQAENKELNKENDRLSQVVLYNEGITKMKVEEAYKKFAEEIFELFPKDKCNTVISRVTVKHILKELGANNAKG